MPASFRFLYRVILLTPSKLAIDCQVKFISLRNKICSGSTWNDGRPAIGWRLLSNRWLYAYIASISFQSVQLLTPHGKNISCKLIYEIRNLGLQFRIGRICDSKVHSPYAGNSPFQSFTHIFNKVDINGVFVSFSHAETLPQCRITVPILQQLIVRHIDHHAAALCTRLWRSKYISSKVKVPFARDLCTCVISFSVWENFVTSGAPYGMPRAHNI